MTATNMCSNFGGKWDSPPNWMSEPHPRSSLMGDTTKDGHGNGQERTKGDPTMNTYDS